MKAKTKNIGIDAGLHFEHKLKTLQAGKKLRETTEESIRSFWKIKRPKKA